MMMILQSASTRSHTCSTRSETLLVAADVSHGFGNLNFIFGKEPHILMVLGKFPPGKTPTRKIPTHQTPPGKFSPEKFPPGIFPPFSLIVFLHYFFTWYFVHKWGENVHVYPPRMKIFICPERLSVPTWEKNSNNQRKLTMSSDRFPSWNLSFVNIEYY